VSNQLSQVSERVKGPSFTLHWRTNDASGEETWNFVTLGKNDGLLVNGKTSDQSTNKKMVKEKTSKMTTTRKHRRERGENSKWSTKVMKSLQREKQAVSSGGD